MNNSDFITEIKNTPIMLKIASLMYIIPALALLVFAFFLEYKEYYNFSDFYLYIFGYPLLNILIGIGLYMRNIIAWWIAIIMPYIIVGFGIFMVITMKDSPIIELITGLYLWQVQYLITRPKIKILFKRTDKK
jgi:hypothetical protein